MKRAEKKRGKIHDGKKVMFFREVAADAKSDDGKEYECTVNVGGRHPIVHSKQTGKWFTLSWQDIIEMAIESGIDS